MSDLRAALLTALNKKEMEKQMQIDELKADINEWVKDDTREPDVKVARFQPTNNVSRESFNAVRDNPNKTNGELIKIMKDKGFNPSSVGSLLAQMARQGIVNRDAEGRFTTTQKEYTPIKAPPTTKKKKVTITKRPYVKSGKYATKTGIAALETHNGFAEPAPAPAPAPVLPPVFPPNKPPVPPIAPPPFDPEQLLSTLSFPQVLALYKKIKTLLGDA
jgi:hypothetical protein